MTITSLQSTTATTAISDLNAALATHAAAGGPGAQDIYARATMLPLIASSISLAATLGSALLDELVAAATTAVTPYVAGTVELQRVVGELSVLRALRGLVKGLSDSSRIPSEAVGVARLVVTIFQQVLAVASVV